MKRITGLLALAFTLSTVATIGAGALAPVGACGWYVERSVSAPSVPFHDNYLNRTNALEGTLTTWNDGCGYKQYEYTMWNDYVTSAQWHAHERVWVCGTYEGEYSAAAAVVWSPVWYYGGCGRQATNQYAYEYLPYNGAYLYSAYRDQG